MRYRQLGKWGLRVSEIALGAWVTYGDTVHDKEVIAEIVKIAYDGGVNFFDNADIYATGKAEEIMGEILADYPRHTLVLSSKVVLADVGRRQRPRAIPQAYSRVDHQEPAPFQHRLRRPLLRTSIRRDGPYGRDRLPRSPGWSTKARSSTGERPSGRPPESPRPIRSPSPTGYTRRWSNSRSTRCCTGNDSRIGFSEKPSASGWVWLCGAPSPWEC